MYVELHKYIVKKQLYKNNFNFNFIVLSIHELVKQVLIRIAFFSEWLSVTLKP